MLLHRSVPALLAAPAQAQTAPPDVPRVLATRAQIDGGSSDDQLKGGDGRDVIDGGPAAISVGERHDRVLYSDRFGRVTVDLTHTDTSQGTSADPSQGIPAEGDTIRDVEDIVSGRGNDFLIGNQLSNVIDGGAGDDDAINGREGRDVINGGDGIDFLSPSPAPAIVIPIGAVPDGQPDVIECGKVGVNDGDPGDTAFRVVIDGDVVNDCATVIDQSGARHRAHRGRCGTRRT